MRLAGQARCGYYPAPPLAVAAALQHLDTARKPFSILDPCAGEGLALEQIAAVTGGMPHGIELDVGRAKELAARVPKSLGPASVFGCKLVGSVELLWLNPPYDDEIGGGQRTEASFLQHCTTWLRPGGVLCLVVPEKIIAPYTPVKQALWERYEEVSYMPFPAEVRRFNEVIVFGYRRAKTNEDWMPYNHVLPFVKDDMRYIVASGHGPRTFEKVELTSEELGRALAASPLQNLLSPPKEIPLPRPPLPLAKGHIAMLLASGHLDGIVRPDGEPPHVVRGTAQKKMYLKEQTEDERDDGETVTKSVYAEKIILSIRAIDRQGNLKTFGQE